MDTAEEVPEHSLKEESNSENSNSSGGEWTEIDEDGWENVLGTGRLRRRIITSAEVQEVRPTRGDHVKVKIIGKFQGKVFEEHEAFEFCCEEGEAIKALDLVVALMYPGETDEFIADPDLAFGSFGLPPHLPPKGAVEYEVTLLEHVLAPNSPLDLDFEARMAIGLRKKERGNFWFSRSEYTMAVQCYRKAVEYFEDDRIEVEVSLDRYLLEQPLQDMITEKIKAYNNLAQSQLKLEAYDSCLASLRHVLKLEPNNEKALFRKAKALAQRGETELAIGTLRRVTRLYKENKLAQADLQRLVGKQAAYNQSAKNMSKKMLGLDKYEEEQAVKKAEAAWSFKRNLIVTSLVGGLGAFLACWYNNVF